MKRVSLLCLFQSLVTALMLAQSTPIQNLNEGKPAPLSKFSFTGQTSSIVRANALESYGNLPLSFEVNSGQIDRRVRFFSRTGMYTLFLTSDDAVFAVEASKAAGESKVAGAAVPSKFISTMSKASTILSMKLRNADPLARIIGVDELAGTSNYFVGRDPANWRTNVRMYAKVKYEGIYPGIDLLYYGNQRQLEYDFIVRPRADPHRIVIDFKGAKEIRRDAHGNLILKIGDEEMRWRKPVAYQTLVGKRRFVAARYSKKDPKNPTRVVFEIAKYDTNQPLYIDPLMYSTYLDGSSSTSSAYGIAVDTSGDAFVIGTASVNFPTTPGAFQSSCGGDCNGNTFVTKFNPSGSALIYSTYIGGSGSDVGSGIVADSAGDVYVTGSTTSSDFPVTPGAVQSAYGGNGDAFLAELNPGGSALIYSSYLGGSNQDFGSGVTVDSAGNAYVAGGTCSSDFPVTPGAFQTTYSSDINCLETGFPGDAFITEIKPSASPLVYSTYLGGSSYNMASGIALDSSGNAYVTGLTGSSNFPITPDAVQTTYGGSVYNAFVAKINSTGSSLLYSTYLGGSGGAIGSGIAVDNSDNAYVTGGAGLNFPTTPGAFQTSGGGAFVSKLNPTGSSLVYSSDLNGAQAYAIAIDSTGDAYVTGYTGSKTFPTTPGAFQTVCKGCGKKAGGAGFVTKFNSTGSALVYSTYLGGSGGNGNDRAGQQGTSIAVDSAGDAYVTGWTESVKFPTTHGAFQTSCNGDDCHSDTFVSAFVTKLDPRAETTTVLSSSPNPSSHGDAVTFTAAVSSEAGVPPDGSVSFIKGKTVLGTGELTNGTATFATSTLKEGTTTVKAVYDGDSTFANSTSKAVKQVVN
jgi:hypothetical protein